MLIVASATLFEVSTVWRHTIFGGCQNLDQGSLCECILLLNQASLKKLSRQREGNKHSLARTVAIGLMGQPSATVHSFFDL